MTDLTVPTRVLIVEDDPNIVDLIRANLAVRGFDTLVSFDGSKALALLETEQPDMVLLDLMLPEVDGFELCRQIRERSNVAIIVVSARGGERDKVTALNMGADDYMTKPFGIEELLARILATLRRTRPAEAMTEVAPSVITIGDVEIDLVGQLVRLAGEEVHLTPTEFALLRELAREPGQAAVPRPPAAPGVGARVRDRDRVRPGVHQAAARQARTARQPAADHHPAAGRLPDRRGLAGRARLRRARIVGRPPTATPLRFGDLSYRTRIARRRINVRETDKSRKGLEYYRDRTVTVSALTLF